MLLFELRRLDSDTQGGGSESAIALRRQDHVRMPSLSLSVSFPPSPHVQLSLSLFLHCFVSLCLSSSPKLIWSLAMSIMLGVRERVGARAPIFWWDINIA